jgi:gamma-glutamylcyclotransferase
LLIALASSIINAVARTFLYFAYGSNMLTRRLKGRTPSADAVSTGFVEGHSLIFDKVSSDCSGKADIEVSGSPADRVYGVLFSIATEEESSLDRAEGLGKGYRKDEVQVVTPNGVAVAIAYIATEKDPAYQPYHWYKALVIAGAVEHNLPDSYIEWLRTVDSKPDPNTTRRAENEALLIGS